MTDTPVFSRSGNSSILGKNTEEIATKVDVDTFEKISSLARQAGMSTSEFARTIFIARAHGLKATEEAYVNRLRFVAGGMPEE